MGVHRGFPKLGVPYRGPYYIRESHNVGDFSYGSLVGIPHRISGESGLRGLFQSVGPSLWSLVPALGSKQTIS